MGPRLVQHPNIRPMRCALLPSMGPGNERVGFFDFGTDLDLDHVYVSFTAFTQMCALAGFVPAKAQVVEAERLRARAEEAERKLAGAEQELEAVAVLRRGGFESARKPGRPKKGVAA